MTAGHLGFLKFDCCEFGFEFFKHIQILFFLKKGVREWFGGITSSDMADNAGAEDGILRTLTVNLKSQIQKHQRVAIIV